MELEEVHELGARTFNNGEWTAAVVFEAAHRAGHLLAHGARRRGGGVRGWAMN